MDALPKIPLRERLNPRVLAFIAIMLGVVGYPLYIYIDSIASGGVKHRADGLVEVDLKAMSTFVFDQVNGKLDDVPEKWRALSGKKVVMEGEMYAPNSAGPNVANFQIVYSIQKCCMSGAPLIQHFVNAEVVGGRDVPYYAGLVRASGTLKVDVKYDVEIGKVVSVYELAVDSVEPM